MTWLPLILLIITGLLAKPFIVKRHWQKNKIMKHPFKGSVSEDGIKWKIEGLISSRVPWNLFLYYRESPDMLLVYQSINQVYYFFPKFLEDENQWSDLKEIISKKLTRK